MPKVTNGRGQSGRAAPMAEINIIPLVDVMLVLLIIFMATTAFVKDSELGLKLPQAKNGSSVAAPNRDLTIGLTRAGALYFDGAPIPEAQLAPQLRARLRVDAAVHVSIKADGGVPYERVVKIMDIARGAGLKSVALGTRAPDGR